MSNPAFQVKNKMTVAVNADNFTTVKEFVNDLPENSGVANISNLVLYLINKVKELSKQKVNNTGEDVSRQMVESLGNKTHEVISLKSELGKVYNDLAVLKKELETKNIWIENASKETNHKYEVSKDLEDFKNETSQAMKMLFNNNDLRPLNNSEMIELMLDYCKRDPSSEFPFEPVATKIYNNILLENNGEKRAETGAGNAIIETVNNGSEGEE